MATPGAAARSGQSADSQDPSGRASFILDQRSKRENLLCSIFLQRPKDQNKLMIVEDEDQDGEELLTKERRRRLVLLHRQTPCVCVCVCSCIFCSSSCSPTQTRSMLN